MYDGISYECVLILCMHVYTSNVAVYNIIYTEY